MSIPSTESKNTQPPLIIYRTYTPQRQAYALTYYQQNKEELKIKRRAYYEDHKDDIKQHVDYKDKCKTSHSRYLNKLREDPEKLEAYEEKRRQYYEKRKLNKNKESGGLES